MGRAYWCAPTAVSIALAAGLTVSSAQTQQQIDACTSKGNISPDIQIGACTAMIQSGRWSGTNLAWAFTNRGGAHFDNMDYDRAIADFDQAIRLNPKSSNAFIGRGMSFAAKDQYDRAIQDYNQSIRLDPSNGNTYYQRGKAKLGSNDVWGYRFDFLKAKQLGVSSADSYVDTPVIPTVPAQQLSLEREKELKPKDVFRECDACPEMVVIPAGSFTMGSPASEPERSPNEGPQRMVTFAQNIAVGKFAVTFREWDLCVADGGCNGHRPDDMGWGHGRQPVINVSWYDAKAYLSWLSQKTGKTYRLLSESEREYAARAGNDTPFWWGSSISDQQANYVGSVAYNNGPKGERRRRTVPVDWFQPNPWGLYQVHGNVYDWVEDCWNDIYSGAPTDGSAWTSGECKTRMVRGGSYAVSPEAVRSAYRNGGSTDTRGHDIGFRVARTLAPVTSGTVAPAPAESEFQQLQSVLSKIANIESSRFQNENKWDLRIENGIMIWKKAIDVCWQSINQAKMSDLDLQKSSMENNPRLGGTVFLKIPCKSGHCVRQDYGTHVWDVLGKCTRPLVSSSSEKTMFAPDAIREEFAAELLAAVKGR